MNSEGGNIEGRKNFPKEALSYYRAMVQVLLSDFRHGLLDEREFKKQTIALVRQLKATKDGLAEMPDCLHFFETGPNGDKSEDLKAAEAQARFHAQIKDKWPQPRSVPNSGMSNFTDALLRGYWPSSRD